LDKNQFETIIDRLDKLTKLIALQSVRGETTERDKIMLLSDIGFRPAEIGKLLGKTPTNISVVLTQMKKKREISPDIAPAVRAVEELTEE
jgi:hypothetical protein